MDHREIYLVGIQFTVVTDCNSVRASFSKKDLIPRIGRWWMKIQEYTFEINHRAGDSMKHADALSRNPVGEPEETECADGIEVLSTEISYDDWLTLGQRADKQIKFIAEVLEKRTQDCNSSEKKIKNEFELKEGRVFRKANESLLLYVPKRMQWRVTKMSHDDLAHMSLDRTKEHIRQNYWFPRMHRYVKGYRRNRRMSSVSLP